MQSIALSIAVGMSLCLIDILTHRAFTKAVRANWELFNHWLGRLHGSRCDCGGFLYHPFIEGTDFENANELRCSKCRMIYHVHYDWP